ncbi:MAG: hypothetical protein JXR94_17150, partial [Candidatus Hydrogenedentes bacterium]|nr:hypothetical protein [Candidatus Hydrogenedentota bacterium]
VFFLDRENRKPVSGDALVRDHDLARREACYGPTLCGWDAPYRNAALFGIDDGRTAYGLLGHRMDYVLRPGESMVFRWDNVGKYAYERSEGPHRYYGNSKIVYEPALTEGPFEGAAESAEGYAPSANGLVCAEGHGALVIRTDTCYTICGGTATAVFSGGTDGTLFAIASSLDGKEYTPVWRHSGQEARAEAHLDEALGLHGNPPRRTHYVRFSVENGPGSVLAGIRIETDIVAAPLALPRLATGTNQVEYTDTTAAPHEVLITHEWIECSSVVPPRPPETPVSPAPHEILRETYVQFRWPSVPGCSGYHIRVSRRPDMRYAFRPNYDVVVPENGHRVPWRGMFSPGETYYWNVRPRLASGVWGSWSPVWRFEWAGPMVPRGVRLTQEGDEFFLRWEPNPGGTRPVRYDVYGSDERGFSVNRAFHEVPGLGTVPGNFVASTTDTQLRVIGPATDGPGMNRAYYRVVAVDARGVEGCPSDFAEAPRPYVFTRPVGEAAVGQPYSYALDTIRSIGDFQHRYDEPGHAYWEREAYLFAIERGPAWLHVDEATGLLSGTPGADGVGDAEVVVHVTTEYPAEVPVTAKSGEDFQNRRTRPDLKRECRHRFVIHVAG